MLAGAVILAVLAACGSEGERTYLEICLGASRNAVQRASCRCMAAEYAKVLSEEEYAAVGALMARAAASASGDDAARGPIGTYVEPTEATSEQVVTAFAKMEVLHRAGACGYGRAPPAGPTS